MECLEVQVADQGVEARSYSHYYLGPSVLLVVQELGPVDRGQSEALDPLSGMAPAGVRSVSVGREQVFLAGHHPDLQGRREFVRVRARGRSARR